jgi:hypothetical protein
MNAQPLTKVFPFMVLHLLAAKCAVCMHHYYGAIPASVCVLRTTAC